MARTAYSKQKLEEIGLDAFHHLDREPRTAYPRHFLPPPPPNHHHHHHYRPKPFYPNYQKPKFVAEPQHPQTMFFTTYQPPRAYLVQLNPETDKEEVICTAVLDYDQPHYGDYPPARKSTAMAAAAAYYECKATVKY